MTALRRYVFAPAASQFAITIFNAALAALSAAVTIFVWVFLRVYRGFWRFTSLDDIKQLFATDRQPGKVASYGLVKRASDLGAPLVRVSGSHSEGLTKFEAADTPLSASAVRFGNVLASTGSVVPLFEEQIARGGPVTNTNPNVNRYFMTTKEAAALVLQTAALNQSQKNNVPNVYVLEMAEPVNIIHLENTYVSGVQRLTGIVIDAAHVRSKIGTLLSMLDNRDRSQIEKALSALLLITYPMGRSPQSIIIPIHLNLNRHNRSLYAIP